MKTGINYKNMTDHDYNLMKLMKITSQNDKNRNSQTADNKLQCKQSGTNKNRRYNYKNIKSKMFLKRIHNQDR